MARKSASDSTAGRVAAARNTPDRWEVPDGLAPLNDAEQAYWDSFTTSRSTWTDAGLDLVHMLVKMQVRFLKIEEECLKTPLTQTLASGSEAEHPIHRMRREELKLLHAQYRICGLQSPYPRSSTVPPKSPSGRGKRSTVSLIHR